MPERPSLTRLSPNRPGSQGSAAFPGVRGILMNTEISRRPLDRTGSRFKTGSGMHS